MRKREQLRFALLALIAIIFISLIQAVATALVVIGRNELPALITEAQAWVAGKAGLLAFMIAVMVLFSFAILYFTSGWSSRWFAKRLAATGKT